MEILSPASNMKHIQVAIDEKANAVYGGLKKWNARNKAINFTNEEYNMLIKELHKNNIKFFLTLNILMLDDEINEVIEFLKNNSLPDAFIVTDIGLIKELHKNFPKVPLHFSTQFGAHNIDDVNYIKSLGGERTILARELTLDEINNIKKQTDIELECFIWGSQCLSFSGLCFFGTLINSGGGNRGKCIITCRDIYSINNDRGHFLYVPDMDCLNLVSKLNDIDCLKLEGRRRNSEEIRKILKKISDKNFPNKSVGYLLGTDTYNNKLYEKINTRTKPVMKASLLEDVSANDICVKYVNNVPQEFSIDYKDPNVMYIYSEIKKDYAIEKNNLALDLTLNNNVIKEVLYMNYKGTGRTFYGDEKDLIEINLNNLIKQIEEKNRNINIYKIKYQKLNNMPFKINKYTYNDIINYILEDNKKENYIVEKGKSKLDTIYLETNSLNVIEEFINDSFVKIIYNIETIDSFKKIDSIIEKYGNKIIYKLPLFNWKSENIKKYLYLLEYQEVMFTRLSQIELCKDIKFKKKYTDYTIYIWNKITLDYLKENNFEEFTSSPELSFKTNKRIFQDDEIQVIIGGKLPLVYTRNCFSHLYNCSNCKNNQCNKKEIKNEDKNLKFEIYCNNDYRYILNEPPMLNDYSKIFTDKNVKFRYVALGQTIQEIKESINCFKKNNYYEELKNTSFWNNSYECNLFEGKE